ncbi:hypothetical protein PILCRDRAFT_2232 [Piloderma croceum F 1598]|uniref:Uncharacterized protein n=1 Tax=Piloderma croceum (strain F 1598) TaxID=765440 RepID=A0A0C3G155_PILCF|nr:hypothetical protein PILCRDRAFT_2232 [Piloderma croceum F 1598]
MILVVGGYVVLTVEGTGGSLSRLSSGEITQQGADTCIARFVSFPHATTHRATITAACELAPVVALRTVRSRMSAALFLFENCLPSPAQFSQGMRDFL